MTRPTVLLTNDDGYWAPGLRALHDAIAAHYDARVVAPDRHLSGCGHGITIIRPLRHDPLPEECAMRGHRVGGTPADCVKLARFRLLDAPPMAVLSGINIGENTGVSAFYSGTLAGTREGALWGLPAVAFSVDRPGAEFLRGYAARAVEIFAHLLALPEHADHRNPHHIVYNVNFPACAPELARGPLVCRQSLVPFQDHYEWREDHEERGPGLWLAGDKREVEDSPEYDSRAIRSGYITITPLDLDTTAQDRMESLREWFGA